MRSKYLRAILVFLLILLFTSCTPKEPDEYIAYAVGTNFTANLTSCWDFEDDAVDSVGGYDGANSGADFITGRVGAKAVEFIPANNDHIEIADSADDPFDVIPAVTINMWLNGTDRATVNSRVFHINSGLSLYWEHASEDEWRMRVDAVGNIEVDAQGYATPYGEWGMFTFSWEPGNYSFYWNGVSVFSEDASNSGLLDDLAVSLYLGIDEDETNYEYDGMMDELSFWQRKLPDAEILALYNSSVGVTCAAMIASGDAPAATPYPGPDWRIDADADCSNTDGNLTSPFCSMFNLSTITIQAGDTVKFDNCDIHRGEYTFTEADGTSGNEIKIGQYGDCPTQQPRIWGSINVTSCNNATSNGGSIWECNKGDFPEEVNMVFYDVDGYADGTGYPLSGSYNATATDLDTNWKWWWNTTNDAILIYYAGGNIITDGDGIEAAQYESDNDGVMDVDSKDYYFFENITYNFCNHRCIRGQHAEKVTTRYNNVNYAWEKSIYYDGFPGVDTLVINYNNLSQTGWKARNNHGNPGNQGEGIFVMKYDNVEIQNNRIQNNWGVVINLVNVSGFDISYNWINGSEYDNQMAAGIYPEASWDGVISYNNITRLNASGINRGAEVAERFDENITIMYNIVVAYTQLWNSDVAASVFLNDANVHHNTWILRQNLYDYSNDRAIYMDNIEHTRFYDNLIYIDRNNEYSYFTFGPTYTNISSDYNLYYTTAGLGNWTIEGDTTYTGLTAWTAQTGNDSNSAIGDPLFVDYANSNYQPYSNSPACSMSSTSSYVGAIACSAESGAVDTSCVPMFMILKKKWWN